MWRRDSRDDETLARLAALSAAVERAASAAEAARDESSRLHAELDGVRAEAAAAASRHELELTRQREILQLLYDREPEMRERLRTLRATPDYELAFTAPDPLVSIVIPTYDRGPLLASRAIPSVLAQTHQNFEIVVVGDAAPAETGELLAAIGDDRIVYRNLERRGPYPDGGRELWHVAGIPPRNEGMRIARGRWIAPLDDDDAFHPRHVEQLLELARRERQEVAYGRLRCLMDDGSEFSLGAFPPEFGQFGWQGAIFHASLRTFEMELADSLFGSPADWSLCRRLLRAGVRFGMLDDDVTDHYQSRLGSEAES